MTNDTTPTQGAELVALAEKCGAQQCGELGEYLGFPSVEALEAFAAALRSPGPQAASQGVDEGRDEFERIANASIARHSVYTDQYDDSRTNELWNVWKLSRYRLPAPALAAAQLDVADAMKLEAAWAEGFRVAYRQYAPAAHLPIPPAPALASGAEPMRKHVEDFATAAGWKREEGEGAFEFVQRTSYHQGWQDGRREGMGDVHRDTPEVPAQAAAVPEAFTEIFAELAKATAKFPTWPTDPLHALAVLGEEFGELTKDILQSVYEPHKTNRDNVRKEALQTAAMALRFFASLDRYDYVQGPQHSQDAQ